VGLPRHDPLPANRKFAVAVTGVTVSVAVQEVLQTQEKRMPALVARDIVPRTREGADEDLNGTKPSATAEGLRRFGAKPGEPVLGRL